jgi:cyclophilin family peptidyl-prolyl cis-trans isomerase
MKTKIALLTICASMLLFGCVGVETSQDESKRPNSQLGSTEQYSTTSQPENTMNNNKDGSNLQLAQPVAGDTVAIIDTDYGTIKFKLFTEQVPGMTTNFMELAKAGKYDNVPFHRVIKNFMIQTGDFTNKNGTGGHSYKGPGTYMPDELVPSIKHLYGTVSMAKTMAPNTSGSQFFIVTSKSGTPHLDMLHSVFGQVYEGMDVAEKIAALQEGPNGETSHPATMKKVTIQKI